MDRDEILKKSREENKNRDFVEAEVLNQANAIAMNVGILMCGVLAILHVIFRDTVDYGVWTVYFSTLSATMIVKFAKLRRRHELLLGLCYGACCVMFLFFYVKDLMGTT